MRSRVAAAAAIPFTRADRIAFAVLASFAGLLSMTGASLIIYMILSRQCQAHHRDHSSYYQRSTLLTSASPQRPTYHRLLLAMSVYTLTYALSSAIGPLAVPKWTGGYGCIGNRATCSTQGFFIESGLGELFYNAGLSVYYVAVVRYNMKDNLVSQRLEPLIHVGAFAVTFTIGVSGLALTAFNPQVVPELGCWFSPYPLSCYNTTELCERGQYFQQLSWAVYAQQCCYVLIVIVMSALLYYTVRSQHRSMSLYASRESLQMREKTREVAYQAFYFAVACIYVNMWVIIVATIFKFQVSNLSAKIVLYMASFATPSQGFFNFLIYIRPRYVRMRRRKPGASRWRVLYDVVRGDATGNNESQRFVATAAATPSNNTSGPFPQTSSLLRMLSLTSVTGNMAGGGGGGGYTAGSATESRSRVIVTHQQEQKKQQQPSHSPMDPALANEVKEEEIANTNSLSDIPEVTASIVDEGPYDEGHE